jgi:hypothetical protein
MSTYSSLPHACYRRVPLSLHPPSCIQLNIHHYTTSDTNSSCFSQRRRPPVTVLFLTPKHSSLHPVLSAPPPSRPFNQPRNSTINVRSLPVRSHSAHGTGPPSLPLPRKEQLPIQRIILQLRTPSASYFSVSLNASPCSTHCVYETSRQHTLVGDFFCKQEVAGITEQSAMQQTAECTKIVTLKLLGKIFIQG